MHMHMYVGEMEDLFINLLIYLNIFRYKHNSARLSYVVPFYKKTDVGAYLT